MQPKEKRKSSYGHRTNQDYIALFREKPTNPEDVRRCLETLEDPDSRCVLPPTALKCDAPIDIKEVESTMNNLATGKSPGPDRLPNRLYYMYLCYSEKSSLGYAGSRMQINWAFHTLCF